MRLVPDVDFFVAADLVVAPRVDLLLVLEVLAVDLAAVPRDLELVPFAGVFFEGELLPLERPREDFVEDLLSLTKAFTSSSLRIACHPGMPLRLAIAARSFAVWDFREAAVINAITSNHSIRGDLQAETDKPSGTSELFRDYQDG